MAGWFLWLAVLLGTCVVGTGCASPMAQSRAQSPERLQVSPLGWGGLEGADGRSQDVQGVPGVLAPGQLMTPELATRLAVERHPCARALATELDVRRADASQQAQLANPEAEAQWRLGTTGSDAWEGHVQWDVVPVLARPTRARIARSATQAASERLARDLLALAHAVRQRYFRHLADLHRHRVELLVRESAEASLRAAQLLHQAGNVEDMQLAQARTDLARARLFEMQAQQQARLSRQALAEAMGLEVSQVQDTWRMPEELPEPLGTDAGSGAMAQAALAANRDLAIWDLQLVEAAARLELSRWQGWLPRLAVGVATERDDERWTVGPAISLELPLWDRGQFAREGLAARHRQAQSQREVLARRIGLLAHQLHERHQALVATHGALRGEVLPLHDQLLEATQRRFNAMDVGIFELLRVHRERREALRAQHETLADYWQVRTDLEWLLQGGTPGDTDARASPLAVSPSDSDPSMATQTPHDP